MTLAPIRTLILSAAAALLLAAAGCADRLPAWSRFVAFPSGLWTPAMIVEMEPWPLDSVVVTGPSYSLALSLRHRLPAPRIARIVVEQENLGAPMRRDTLTIHLLTDDGTPAGHGLCGLYSLECPVPGSVTLAEGYSVAIHPLDSLPGISEAGLILQKN
ncbi:MAG: gliding motility lipoprotein GldH [Muribaculaceae bacterium]|nr:gliding motility lipoprotein GldH [Muribaculaceae bacterium]